VSGGAGGVNAVRVEDIAQGDDALELVDIGAIDDGQDFDVSFAHAFEGEMQGMVGVDVGEVEGFEETEERLFGATVGEGGFEGRTAENADDVSLVIERPGAELTG